jgi:hypothetical protein
MSDQRCVVFHHKELIMYEIWLLIVIAWELMLLNLGWLWILPAVAALGLAFALRDGAKWGQGFKGALAVGVLVAVVFGLWLPTHLASSLSELRYWVDWAVLAGSALAAGLVGCVISWPWVSRWQGHSRG